MRRRPTLSALALTFVMAGAGCSSGANSADVHAPVSTIPGESSSTPSTATPGTNIVTSPSPGAVTSKDKAFTFVVPSGWNLTDNPNAVAYLSSATVAHNVAPTIVVTKSQVTPAPALDETLQRALMQARQNGDSPERLPVRTIGGEQAAGFTVRTRDKNVAITRTYDIVAHNGTLYTVVLTAATADAKSGDNTLNALLASWTWTKQGDKNSTASGTTPAAIPTTTSTSSSPTSNTSSASTGSGTSSAKPAPTPSKSRQQKSSTASPSSSSATH